MAWKNAHERSSQQQQQQHFCHLRRTARVLFHYSQQYSVLILFCFTLTAHAIEIPLRLLGTVFDGAFFSHGTVALTQSLTLDNATAVGNFAVPSFVFDLARLMRMMNITTAGFFVGGVVATTATITITTSSSSSSIISSCVRHLFAQSIRITIVFLDGGIKRMGIFSNMCRNGR